jgi:hypothetical protein
MIPEGPLGKKVQAPPPPAPPEKWIPLENHPDYVKSTTTGAVKRKGD